MKFQKLLSLTLLGLVLTACAQNQENNTSTSTTQSTSTKAHEELQKALTADSSAFPQLSETVADDEAQVILHTTKGDIAIKLFPRYAPLAVENFLTHAKDGYYNGLIFHRVIKDFMIQGGDPKGNGTGGESIWQDKDTSIDKGTGFTTETTPYLYNIRGALAMANTGAPNSNGSQFFINQNPQNQSGQLNSQKYPGAIINAYGKGGNPSLDGGYTVFGQVISGLDVVDTIANVATDSADKPLEDVKIDSIEIVKDYTFK